MKLAADLLALVSAGFLSVPAWYLNYYARRVARATLNHAKFPDKPLADIHSELTADLVGLRDRWTPAKAWCLHIGTVAGLLATLLALLDTLCEHFKASGAG